MYCAEMAMRAEQKLEEKLERQVLKTKEAVHLAALMWAIYWPEKVEKAKMKEAKRSGVPVPTFDSPV
jgi:hypothetical protein